MIDTVIIDLYMIARSGVITPAQKAIGCRHTRRPEWLVLLANQWLDRAAM